MTEFTIGSQWRTRGGWRAIVVDYDGERPIIWHSKDGSVRDCDCNGYDNDGYGIGPGYVADTDFTSTPWKGPVIHEGWVNVYDFSGITFHVLHNDRDIADRASRNADGSICRERIACISIKFTEGEGL